MVNDVTGVVLPELLVAIQHNPQYTMVESYLLEQAAHRGYFHSYRFFGQHDTIPCWQAWCRQHRYPPVVLHPRRKYAGLSVSLEAVGATLSPAGHVEVLRLLLGADSRRCRHYTHGLYLASDVPIGCGPVVACALVDLCLEHASWEDRVT